MMKEYSVVLHEKNNNILSNHLIRDDGQEDLCFATYFPGTGNERFTAIIDQIIFPESKERNLHGNVGFNSNYLERVFKIASGRSAGIAIAHSHPWPGWQDMSDDDIIAEERISPACMALTKLPLLGLTLGIDGSWSARFWIKDKLKKRSYNRRWCENLRVIGKKFHVTFRETTTFDTVDPIKQIRTISAWGEETQKKLSKLKIGIVGLGSVGSMVAEILARTGVSNLVLIDFDSVEEKNLDRITNVNMYDIGKAKVDAVKEHLLISATSPKISVQAVEYSVCEEFGYKSALDCDIIFSCVDRPWPRQVLNFISYNYLIPVIDGGILVRTNKNNTKLKGADWKVQTVGYGRPCLECLGQYTSENAKLEQEGFIDDPSYIAGLEDAISFGASENVFVFSSYLASMEVLQMLSLCIAPSGVSYIGQQTKHFVTGALDIKTDSSCNDNCFFQSTIGRGDVANVKVYNRHPRAESIRKERENKLLIKAGQ